MTTLYRLGFITFLVLAILLLDYCTVGARSGISIPQPDEYYERDEIELYALMGFEKSECDW